LFLTVSLVMVAFAGINLRNCISNVRQVHTATPTLVSPLPTDCGHWLTFVYSYDTQQGGRRPKE
jgi:hypothetical protein